MVSINQVRDALNASDIDILPTQIDGLETKLANLLVDPSHLRSSLGDSSSADIRGSVKKVKENLKSMQSELEAAAKTMESWVDWFGDV